MTDVDMNGGVALEAGSPTELSNKINSGAMDVVSVADSTTNRLEVSVNRPTPYTFDLGHLLANDPNPISRDSSEEDLKSNARDAAQALINQLLTTCDVKSTTDGVHLLLPQTTTLLPREKPIPAEKAPTKWETFAKKKGIKDKQREGKMVYNEESGDWVPKWGYKGKNKDGDSEWLVEVDKKKEDATGEIENKRADNRRERKERVRRNERKQRSNERSARKPGA